MSNPYDDDLSVPALVGLLALAIAAGLAVTALLAWALTWLIPAVGIPWEPTFWQAFGALVLLDIVGSAFKSTSRG